MNEIDNKKDSVLSSLYAQKRHHETKIDYWKGQSKNIEGELRKYVEQLTAIESKLEKIVDRKIYISSHAISRYRSRIGPLDATEEQIRARILTPNLQKIINTLGSGTYISDDGIVKIVLEDMKIITILKADVTKEEKREHKNKIRKKYGSNK